MKYVMNMSSEVDSGMAGRNMIKTEVFMINKIWVDIVAGNRYH